MKYGYTELLRMYGYRKSLGMTEGVTPRMHSARRLCVSTLSSTPMLPRAGPLAQVSNYSVPMLTVAPRPTSKKGCKRSDKIARWATKDLCRQDPCQHRIHAYHHSRSAAPTPPLVQSSPDSRLAPVSSLLHSSPVCRLPDPRVPITPSKSRAIAPTFCWRDGITGNQDQARDQGQRTRPLFSPWLGRFGPMNHETREEENGPDEPREPPHSANGGDAATGRRRRHPFTVWVFISEHATQTAAMAA